MHKLEYANPDCHFLQKIMENICVFSIFLTLCSLLRGKNGIIPSRPMLILNHLLFCCFLQSNDLQTVNWYYICIIHPLWSCK